MGVSKGGGGKMAQIRVEPKRRGTGWLWAVILLALLGAAAWYFFANSQPASITTPPDSTRTSMIRTPVEAFSAEGNSV